MTLSNSEELEKLFNLIQPKILEYIKSAEVNEKDGKLPSTIGPVYNSPEDLKITLGLDKVDYLEGEGKDLNKIADLVQLVLDNSINTWHPGFLDKLYASTNPIGVISDIVLSVLNTNSHVFTVSPALTLIEKHISHEYAKAFGFKGEHSGGLTFSGGSWSNLTSLQIARSILFPETKQHGNEGKKFAVFASLHSHYSVEKACILMGLGTDLLFKTKVNDKGEMDVEDLAERIESAISKGYTPLYINATAGTTVFGSFDPFEEISKLAKKYKIWFHVDGSWGGNMCFSDRFQDKFKGIELADSITSNPHKMLGVPTTCSFLLVPDKRVFTRANSLDAPYLFHNAVETNENYDLADGTLGCGRRADSLKFFLSWLYYGAKGFSSRVEHAYELASEFADRIDGKPGFKLVSELPLPCLQVCFYYNPKFVHGEVTKEENTQVTRTIAKQLYLSGKFLIDYSPNSDPAKDEGEFFRIVFNSPNVTNDTIDELIDTIVELGDSHL